MSKEKKEIESDVFHCFEEVKSEKFPDEDHSYNVDRKELEEFKNLVEKRKQI